MKLNELGPGPAGRARRRVGRGTGSGLGKTAGRGQKGQGARSGVALGGFEGGQMPIHMRLPKRGFRNPFRKRTQEVTLGRLQAAIDAGRLDPARVIDAAVLAEAGVIRRARDGIRVIGGGTLTAAVTVRAAGASAPAVAAIEKAGGKLEPAAAAGSGRRKGRGAGAAPAPTDGSA